MPDDPHPNCPRWDEAPDELKRAIIRRVLSDAAPVVAWPGRLVASHRPAKGERAESLEAPIAVMVDLRFRGRPTAVAANVRFAQVRTEAWGEALVFDVVAVTASSSGEGRTRRASKARVNGELVVDASDGEFIALHLRGPFGDLDTEASDADPTAGLNPCTTGVLSVDITWSACFTPA